MTLALLPILANDLTDNELPSVPHAAIEALAPVEMNEPEQDIPDASLVKERNEHELPRVR